MKFLGPTRYNNASFPSIDFSFLGKRSRVSTSNYLVHTSEFVHNGVHNEEKRKRCEGLRGIPSWKGQSLGTRVLNNFLVCRVSTIVAVVYCLGQPLGKCHSFSVDASPTTPSPLRPFRLAGDSTLPYASPRDQLPLFVDPICLHEGRMPLVRTMFANA